jgi:hypothetical protein
LPAAVVRQIEADLAAGTRREAVAERYGCGLGTISSINCRRHPHQRPGARGASVFHLK